MPLRLTPTLRDTLAAAERPLLGMWVCSGSALVAEICAGSGVDWLLLDMEHSPNDLTSILRQLQAVDGHPVTPVVRVPSDDATVIKQVLDLGATNLVVPMVSSPEQAQAVVAAVRYPPGGVRGIGAALARSGRWGRDSEYLSRGDERVGLVVQIETVEAVEKAERIAAIDGIDGLFVGPSDLAASMGLLGQQTHHEVVRAAEQVISVGTAAGVPVGINAFDPAVAGRYLDAGASFVLRGADVTLLAAGSERLTLDPRGDGTASRD